MKLLLCCRTVFGVRLEGPIPGTFGEPASARKAGPDILQPRQDYAELRFVFGQVEQLAQRTEGGRAAGLVTGDRVLRTAQQLRQSRLAQFQALAD